MEISKNKAHLIGAVVLVILIFAGFKLTGFLSADNPNLDDFATCLTNKGVTMYGTSWCSHCQNQKKKFGESFNYIDFVDCDTPDGQNKCAETGIKGFPTWVIDGKLFPGEQPLEKLAFLTGCELK